MYKEAKHALRTLRTELKNAGGNFDIVVFPRKVKRIIKALDNLEIFWGEVDREIYVNRHELDAVLTKE